MSQLLTRQADRVENIELLQMRFQLVKFAIVDREFG
ncbi:hypothetical protein BH24CHL4_BH24CHL4_16860 [soil metagenome]